MNPVISSSQAAVDVFERLLEQRSQLVPSSNIQRLRAAFADAQYVYEGCVHWMGEDLLAHCVAVLETYLSFEPDDDGIIACLLHHALDSKRWTLDDVEKAYGPVIRSIVSGVHVLSHVTMRDRRMSLENLRLMFLRVSDDVRVVLLILCDHDHKLERLHVLDADMRRTVCRDMLHLFAPVAARLGIYSLKHQMEAHAFPVVYPTDSARITEQLSHIHARHGYFLDAAARTLEGHMQESGIRARVEAREKQPYSIFQKMRTKSLTHVEDVYDLFALRVIVESESACYQALGTLHRIGHPVAHRFKDYIAFPKPNGYQSLHTTLARLPGVPEGIFIEVQIRTPTMHREADLGIAAHWNYKEGGTAEHAARRAHVQRALTQPLENSPRSAVHDHIFALTPKGDIIELPEGATPLDFAFHVHSILGLCFKAARVNGSIVPLSYQLENGDIVEILRYKEPHPSSNWMTVLKTPSAKARLKRYLMDQDKPTYIQRGRDALNAELARHGLAPLDPDLTMLRHVNGVQLTYAEREDILLKLGHHAQTVGSLLSQLDALPSDILVRVPEERKIVTQSIAPKVRVEGNIPMPIRYARCCKPDEHMHGALTGVIGRDGSVRVHRATCNMTRNVNRERFIGVRWEQFKDEK